MINIYIFKIIYGKVLFMCLILYKYLLYINLFEVSLIAIDYVLKISSKKIREM